MTSASIGGLHPDCYDSAAIVLAMSNKIDEFLPYLDNSDLSPEDKRILLEHLWSVVESFADDAWGLSPTQHSAANDNGQQISTTEEFNSVKCLHADNDNQPLPQSASDRRKQSKG